MLRLRNVATWRAPDEGVPSAAEGSDLRDLLACFPFGPLADCRVSCRAAMFLFFALGSEASLDRHVEDSGDSQTSIAYVFEGENSWYSADDSRASTIVRDNRMRFRCCTIALCERPLNRKHPKRKLEAKVAHISLRESGEYLGSRCATDAVCRVQLGRMPAKRSRARQTPLAKSLTTVPQASHVLLAEKVGERETRDLGGEHAAGLSHIAETWQPQM